MTDRTVRQRVEEIERKVSEIPVIKNDVGWIKRVQWLQLTVLLAQIAVVSAFLGGPNAIEAVVGLFT